MERQTLLFQNLKMIKDHWVDVASKSLKSDADLIWSDVPDDIKALQRCLEMESDKESFRKVQNDIIQGVIHSILVMIDGGDALADKMKVDFNRLK
jgi:hypothetical protein